jgi:hypothetical protein
MRSCGRKTMGRDLQSSWYVRPKDERDQREESCGVVVPVWLAKGHEQGERRRCSEPSD